MLKFKSIDIQKSRFENKNFKIVTKFRMGRMRCCLCDISI